METHELLMTALHGAGVYVLMLVVVRIAGKRTIGNFTAFDLLVALMLGEVVDEIIYGDVTFLQGTIAIVVVALLHYGNSWLSYYAHGLDKVLEGTPTVVVRNGALVQDGMRAERLNERDVLSLLRQQGVTDMREVHLAVVENDGQMSVLEHDWAQPVRKADIDEEAERRKEEAGGGETPPEKRTDRDIEGGK
jgi:uncharacterized membrane protein YcaP (DUF421 family)